MGAKKRDRWNGELQSTINRSYGWKDGEKVREAIMEGIMAEIFPGNILAAMCEFNFSLFGGLKTWALEPERFWFDSDSIFETWGRGQIA